MELFGTVQVLRGAPALQDSFRRTTKQTCAAVNCVVLVTHQLNNDTWVPCKEYFVELPLPISGIPLSTTEPIKDATTIDGINIGKGYTVFVKVEGLPILRLSHSGKPYVYGNQALYSFQSFSLLVSLSPEESKAQGVSCLENTTAVSISSTNI